jgi:hypothetical protein
LRQLAVTASEILIATLFILAAALFRAADFDERR